MKLPRRHFLRLAGAGAVVSAFTRTSSAQTYPSRPIIFVVPYAAGGSTDLAARIVAESMAATLRQTITVENVSGGGSTIGTGRVARAAADGLTLLVHQPALATNVTFYPKLPFNADMDLTGVGLINYSPLVMMARKTLPANSLPELISSMKQTGAQVTFALSAGVGSMGHLVIARFETAVGVHFDLVPYRGAAPTVTDILGGHIDVAMLPPENAVEQVRSGNVKGLAVTSAERLAAIPSVPSAVELGFGDLTVRFWQGLFAPSRTPDPIIRRLNEALQIALADQRVRKQFEEVGTRVFPKEEQTPEAATALLHSEVKRWGDVIRANKIELTP